MAQQGLSNILVYLNVLFIWIQLVLLVVRIYQFETTTFIYSSGCVAGTLWYFGIPAMQDWPWAAVNNTSFFFILKLKT